MTISPKIPPDDDGGKPEMSCSTWQPIETAPKDGREFIGYFPAVRRVMIIFWNGDKFTCGEWARCPTHWMPLQELPK